MKITNNKNFTRLSILSITFIFTACSSHNLISTSNTHLYNHDFGIVQNLHADAMIRQEYLAMNKATQIDIPNITDPEISTELIMDADAFLAEDYVQTAPVITYKYKFDPKFYSYAQWRRMDLE